MLKKSLLIIILSINSQILPWSFFGFGSNSSDDAANQKPFTIMIDPAGDTTNPGRKIDEEFEQVLTFQFAKNIKELVESENKNIRIIITRYQSEAVEELQNASFANRLSPDLYLNINFYKETEKPARIYLYYFMNNPVTDLWTKQDNSLKFYSFDQAYKINLNKTIKYTNNIFDLLKNFESKLPIKIMQPIGMPLKQLVGITSPAITIEAGIRHNKNINDLLEPTKSVLLEFANNIIQENHNE